MSGLQGERLDNAKVSSSGISGDHAYVIRTRERSRILDPLTHSSSVKTSGVSGMLELRAILRGDADGEHELSVLAGDQVLFSSKEGSASALSMLLGREVEVVRYPRIVETRVRAGRTLHLITNSSLSRMRSLYHGGDFDERRFRSNLVIDTEDTGFVEDAWVGRDVRLDYVALAVTKTNVRCRMTTMKQAGVVADAKILQAIEQENSGTLGVMCTVKVGGVIRVGSELSLTLPNIAV